MCSIKKKTLNIYKNMCVCVCVTFSYSNFFLSVEDIYWRKNKNIFFVRLITSFTLESNVMLNHSAACIPLVNHVALEFLFQLQPDHLATTVHVHANVLCRVDMSVLTQEKKIHLNSKEISSCAIWHRQ